RSWRLLTFAGECYQEGHGAGGRRPPLGAKFLLEEVDRPLPGKLRRRGVVARGRVVVEAVLRAGVEEHLVPLLVLLERRLVRGPACVDALVGLRVMDEQ